MRIFRNPWVQGFLIFLTSLAWFSWLQSWGAFADPDGFYHAKIAELIATQGPVMSFPWLDLTTLGRSFVDQNYFYHLVLIPFEWAFGMLPGTQIATVLFAALTITAFYAVACWLRVPSPWLWALLFMLMPVMGRRLSWAKSGALVQILFLFGMAALAKRKAWLIFLVSTIYALSHGGWILFLACQVAYVIGEWAVARFSFQERSWDDARSALWAIVASVAGILFGSLLHPNREALWHFFVTTVISIGLVNPVGQVPLGGEWYAPEGTDLFTFFFLPALAGLVVLFGALITRHVRDREAAKRAVGYLCAFAVPFAWSLRSIRFQEYAAPLLVMAIALLAIQVDRQRAREKILEWFPRWLAPLFITAILLVAALQAWDVHQMIRSYTKPFGRFAPAMAVVRTLAVPGERVAHSAWDIFPELFAEDDRYRYVSGLDPTFLLDEHPEVSKAYTDLFLGTTSTGAYELIRHALDARVVVVDRHDHAFESALLSDHRFEVMYTDDAATVFRTFP
ncbi:hypothetical protein IT087_00795 [Candidatus Uhrbacteria bacterium]|nr:hypothetical protein [Candidatus Uhrbacteria bacterium]